MATMTFTLDTGPMDRLISILSQPTNKALAGLGIGKKGAVTKMGKIIERGVMQNFRNKSKKPVSDYTMRKRKMQSMLNPGIAVRTVPPGGGLPLNRNIRVSAKAINNIRNAKVDINLNSPDFLTWRVEDTTRAPDVHPLNIGELELMNEGRRFSKGIRTPKKAKALLIPITNLSKTGGKLRKKRGESKAQWFKRIGAVPESGRGMIILMRGKTRVDAITFPKLTFITFSAKMIRGINKILLNGLQENSRTFKSAKVNKRVTVIKG